MMYHYLKFMLSPILIATSIFGILLGGDYTWLGLILIGIVMLVGDHLLGDDISEPKFKHPILLNAMVWLALPMLLLLELSLAYSARLNFSLSTQTFWYHHLIAIVTVGLMVGYGMAAGHELIHMNNKIAVIAGRWLFALAANPDFSIEHVFGHHAFLGTKKDPATARRGESVYTFMVRSTVFGHLHAWRLEIERLKRKGFHLFSFRNRMLTGYLMIFSWALMFFLISGWAGIGFFIIQAILAKIFLEVVNYIEHYGIERQLPKPVKPYHSWNSNKRFSYIALLGLARHSHHHEKSSIPYYELKPYEGAPLMPFGYLTCLIIALIPHLWFKVMEEPLRSWDQQYKL